MSATDCKCLSLITKAAEPLTAGRLATLSGLSTGATTGMIDRLERAGQVRRIRDVNDRRKVLVEAVKGTPHTSDDAYSRLVPALATLLGEYDAPERVLLKKFIARYTELLDRRAAREPD